MTQNLADQARQIGEDDLKKAQDKIEQSKDQPARNQLEPLAQSIDHLGNVDRKLGQLEQQLNELNKLEQDLAELSRMVNLLSEWRINWKSWTRANKRPLLNRRNPMRIQLKTRMTPLLKMVLKTRSINRKWLLIQIKSLQMNKKRRTNQPHQSNYSN